MAEKFRIAFIGVDHPHGAGWRESISLVQDDARIVAFVNAFGNSSASLEEKYAHLPRFNSVDELLKWGGFDGAVVCLPNNETPPVVIKLAGRAGLCWLKNPAPPPRKNGCPRLMRFAPAGLRSRRGICGVMMREPND